MSEQGRPAELEGALGRIQEAIELLRELGMPPAQQNERSALVLLALLDLRPPDRWSSARRPMRGVTEIMHWFAEHYGREYAPNTRETVRRHTLHPFLQAGFVVQNPDEPERPVNSPNTVYQISEPLYDIVAKRGQPGWAQALEAARMELGSLREAYARRRQAHGVPVKTGRGAELRLSPGPHSELIRSIVEEMCPRFIPGGSLLYVGDTARKFAHFDEEALRALGIVIGEHGKMPDVVVYDEERGWLVLIEAVTSHGPVDPKRRAQLAELFKEARAGLVYVTAFASRSAVRQYLSEISWETEVWVADAPGHMIHFNGERFLGPYPD